MQKPGLSKTFQLRTWVTLGITFVLLILGCFSTVHFIRHSELRKLDEVEAKIAAMGLPTGEATLIARTPGNDYKGLQKKIGG